MARLNDFIDMMKLAPLRQYCEEHGERYRYAKGGVPRGTRYDMQMVCIGQKRLLQILRHCD